jgi:hypothetical protein
VNGKIRLFWAAGMRRIRVVTVGRAGMEPGMVETRRKLQNEK